MIDDSLDPEENPSMLGRYRFTLAHEIGHWRLHRHSVRQGRRPVFLFRSIDLADGRLPHQPRRRIASNGRRISFPRAS
ncbi:MAG: ImmA/IrrE family metallo-endopeptidase [Rhizobiales bacterium]|nr:ImmA/IrrE family metallo-endopeptidase [Hyphomicrobiales bacterium]